MSNDMVEAVYQIALKDSLMKAHANKMEGGFETLAQTKASTRAHNHAIVGESRALDHLLDNMDLDNRGLELRCSKHPTYMAQRPPRANCLPCRKLYRLKHDGSPSAKNR